MYPKELDIALDAAKKAVALIRSYYNASYVVEEKSPDQPVTVADRGADAVIKKTILDCFPDDGWLSEETQDTADRLSQKRVWIVDPLDGTKEFIAKIPEFAVSIGLVEEGRPVVGVIANPATENFFWAMKGLGAFANGQKIQVSCQNVLRQAKILSSRSETKRGEWQPYAGQFEIVMSGGMAHKMSQVAMGVADGSFSLSPKSEWDFCAGDILIQEAGGRVSDLEGHPFVYNRPQPRVTGIIHSNQNLFGEIVSLVKGR